MQKLIGVAKKILKRRKEDDLIHFFKEKKVIMVILKPACYWRPGVWFLFRRRYVINYLAIQRGMKKPIYHSEVLLSIKERSTEEGRKERLLGLSSVVYNRVEELLEKVPGISVCIADEYLKMLGNFYAPLQNETELPVLPV